MKYLLTTIICLFFTAGTLSAQDTRPAADVFAEKLAVMLSDDAGKAQAAQQEWQRYCLELGMPGREVQRAEAVRSMAEALPKVQKMDALKWLVRQFGYIGDASCVEAIGKCFEHENSTVMEIAAWSLGTIPNNEAGLVLEKYLATEKRDFWKKGIQNALDFRKTRQAVTLPKLNEVLKILEGGDKKAWDAALSAVGWLHDVKIADLPDWRARFNKLDPTAKILLLDALTGVRDRSALPAAVDLSNENEETLKSAGLRALGPIGDATVIPVLLKNVKDQTDIGRTARDSLRRLNYDGADEALIAAFKREKDNETKYELLDALRNRNIAAALPVFEGAVADSDEEIRKRSIYALEIIGESTSVPALVARLFKEEKKEFREAVERAVVRINSRYSDEDGRGKTLCEEYFKRPENEQAVILPLIGKVGGPEARKVVLDILGKDSATSGLKAAAFQALGNWPDASVAGELETIASSDGDPRSAQAVRAYIRVVTLRAEDRSAQDSLALFEKAMKLAKTDDDRRFLLTRVETARSMEVFRFVVPYLDNAELEQAACRAVVDMANDHWFYMHNRKEIDPALDKVIEKSKDKNHVDRAKRYKERQ